MSTQRYEQFWNQMSRLYEAGQYQEAYDLVMDRAGDYPEQADDIRYLRFCLSARLGQNDLALDLLEETVNAGLWYPRRYLREDDDLARLQGLPGFERLANLCQARQAAAQAAAVGQMLTTSPAGQPSAGEEGLRPAPLLLALHGNHKNASNTIPHWRPASEEGWLVACPQSSQVDGPDAYVWNDWELAEREITRLHAELLASTPVDEQRAIFGGFSMGGGLALWLALVGRPARPRGFVVLGPWVPDMDRVRKALRSGRAEGQRGVIIVGDEDDECLPAAQELHDTLTAYDVACEYHLLPGLAHEYPEEFPVLLRQAIAFVEGS
jgi:pimeloyl-ACP methyl ester carboxylesterase